MIKIASARTIALGTTTDNPFIAWDNLAATATLGGTATLTDGAASNAVDGNTYDYWLPNVTGATCSFRVTFGAARTISFVGIAAHNLATLGLSAQVQRSIDGGATWLAAGAGSAEFAGRVAKQWYGAIAYRGGWGVAGGETRAGFGSD